MAAIIEGIIDVKLVILLFVVCVFTVEEYSRLISDEALLKYRADGLEEAASRLVSRHVRQESSNRNRGIEDCENNPK